MIREITFLTACRAFPEGLKFQFESGVNLLVGDQGVGKSTLLGALSNPPQLPDKTRVSVVRDEPTAVRYFDFEKDNPRTASTLRMGSDLDIEVEIGTLFMSHGQAKIQLLANLCGVDGPHTFLFDEPDTGLSIRSAFVVARYFRRLAEKGHQIIASVHNPMIMSGFEQVLSIEHCRWMKTSEFIDTQFEPMPTSGSSPQSK